MIEKIDIKDYENKEQLMEVGVINKINTLVDAVNAMQNLWLEVAIVKKTILELQSRAENVQAQAAILQEHAHPTATIEQEKIAQGFKNLQDPFAEQRKWIGKLCWFWDENREYAVTGILSDLSTTEPHFVKFGLYFYEHCEPVKPDDDIIYKGGDNE